MKNHIKWLKEFISEWDAHPDHINAMISEYERYTKAHGLDGSVCASELLARLESAKTKKFVLTLEYEVESDKEFISWTDKGTLVEALMKRVASAVNNDDFYDDSWEVL